MNSFHQQLKRRKTIDSSPNYLFRHWIRRAMEEAFMKETKSYYVYKKAFESLGRYPLLLQSGKECKILEGFGSKLCDLLDAQLINYAKELNMSISEALNYGNEQVKPKKESKTKKSTFIHQPAASIHNGAVSEHHSTTFPNQKDTDELLPIESQICDIFKCSKNPRGCSMAELSACLRYSSSSSLPTGNQLIDLVNRLIERNVIQLVDSCSVRYKMVQFSDNAIPPYSSLQNCIDLTQDEEKTEENCDDNIDSTSYPLSFTYVDENYQEVRRRLEAKTRQFTTDAEMEQSSASETVDLTGYLIRCDYEELLVSGVDYRMDWTLPTLNVGSRFLHMVYLLDASAPMTSTFVDANISAKVPLMKASSAIEILSTHRTTIPKQCPSKFTFKRTLSHGLLSTVNGNSSVRQVEINATDRNPTNVDQHIPSDRSTPNEVIPAGSYELILMADIREQFGFKKVSQLLPSVSQSYQIQCESRALPVGDFLWIARWKNNAGQLMEAVLDYIIERKRMDDLASSIMDGRFKEQKYRLKRTGLLHPTYLIEYYSAMRHQKLSFETMMQAIANAQIIDRFEILNSQDPQETVNLLANMTCCLQSKAKTNDLHVHYTPPTDPSLLNGLVWSQFVQFAEKTPPPSIRDMFAKQLLQISGLSGAKIAPILNQYPTPVSLIEALDEQINMEDKENMLTGLKLSNGNKYVFYTRLQQVSGKSTQSSRLFNLQFVIKMCQLLHKIRI